MIRKLKNTAVFPYILLAVSFIFLLVKSMFGFCLSDEPFYIATAARFYKGDSIFFHEWFPTQLSSLLLTPLYSMYVAIFKGTDGILLFFRILFVIFEFMSSIVVYRIIRKHHGMFFGIIISMLTQWYVHLNIATLSYYTMTMHFFLLAMLLLYDVYKTNWDILDLYADTANDNSIEVTLPKEKSKLRLMLAGFLFALSVLCLPTLCVSYFLVVVSGFVLHLCGEFFVNNKFIKNLINKMDFLYVFEYTLVGILIPAIVFFIYMLTHVSIKNFINSIPYVLSDDEHITSFRYPIKKLYLAIDESFEGISRVAYLFIFISVVIFFVMLLRNYIKNETITAKINNILRLAKPIILVIDVVLFFIYFSRCVGHTGYIFTAIMLFSIPLFMITEKKNWLLFVFFYISGFFYTITYSYSSNGMLYVLAMGHFFCALAGIIMSYDLINELDVPEISVNNRGAKEIFSVLITVLFISSLLITMCHRTFNIYRDDKLSNLTSKITEGPAKGLYTSEAHHKDYDEILNTVENYCMSSSGEGYNNLLVSKLMPVCYLISDLNVAAPSVWRNPMNSERLMEYYKFTENKYPDVVFVLNPEYGSYETCGDVEKDPSPNENDNEGLMYDYLNNNGFKEIKVPCGTVYQR